MATTTHGPSTRTYLVIGGWLAGLMLLGVVLCETPLGLPRAWVIAAVVALSTIKALLVALYYMHLKVDRRFVAFIAVSPFLLLLAVAGLLASHYLVRL